MGYPTNISGLTGRDGVVTINGVLCGWADFKLNFKRGIAIQPRGGMNSDLKMPGKSDMDFSLTNISPDFTQLGLLLSSASVASTMTILQTCDTIGDWTTSDVPNTPIAAETLIKKLGTSSLKISPSGANSTNDYVSATIAAANLTGFHMIEMWVYASEVGAVWKLGMGESAATEQETTITIQRANTWQHVWWDISAIADTAKDAITLLRLTYLGSAAGTAYFDDINALKGMSVGAGVRFDLSGEAVNPADTSKYYKVVAKNCFLTSGGFDFGDADKIINGPVAGTMSDMDTDLKIFAS